MCISGPAFTSGADGRLTRALDEGAADGQYFPQEALDSLPDQAVRSPDPVYVSPALHAVANHDALILEQLRGNSNTSASIFGGLNERHFSSDFCPSAPNYSKPIIPT